MEHVPYEGTRPCSQERLGGHPATEGNGPSASWEAVCAKVQSSVFHGKFSLCGKPHFRATRQKESQSEHRRGALTGAGLASEHTVLLRSTGFISSGTRT